MHFVLHVGLPKTGTTSIQFCLKAHRDRYRRRGIHVPASGQDESGSHLPLIFALESNRPKPAIAELRRELEAAGIDRAEGGASGWFERLRRGVLRQGKPRVLISSERMYEDISLGRFPRILDLLREAGATRYTIVMYLRSPFQQVNSIYAHRTATFALQGLDIAGFAERLTSTEQHQGLRALFDYQRLIEIVRRDDVDLILRPYNGAVAKAVYPDFLQSLGLRMPSATNALRLNASFGPASLEAMRVVAGELGRLSESQWHPLRAFANTFAQENPERVSYWGIDEAIADRLSHLDDQTEQLARFAWKASWRDVIGDERRPVTAFDPGTAEPEQLRIYEAMLGGLRRTAQTLPAR